MNKKLLSLLIIIFLQPCFSQDNVKVEEYTPQNTLSISDQAVMYWRMFVQKLNFRSPSVKSIYSNNQGASGIQQALSMYQERLKELQEKMKQQGTVEKGAAKGGGLSKEDQGFSNDEMQLILQAYLELVRAVGESSFYPVYHLNLGVAFELKKEEAKALNEYQTALKLSPPNSEIAFLSLFNMAKVFSQMNEKEKALNHYVAALKIRPESVEVRNNIEMLWQDQNGEGKGEGGEGEGEEGENSDDQNKEKQDPGDNKKQKQKPKYSGKDFTEAQIRRILNEIEEQEQKIRAKEYEKGDKRQGPGKDW